MAVAIVEAIYDCLTSHEMDHEEYKRWVINRLALSLEG